FITRHASCVNERAFWSETMGRRLNRSDSPNSADATHAKERLLAAFLKCRSPLRRAIGRIVKPDDIDDLLQETFVRAYAAVETNEIRHPPLVHAHDCAQSRAELRDKCPRQND